MLYISEAGGITSAGEPGVDSHWIPCKGNPEAESDDNEAEEDSIPSIGAVLTLVGILSAAAFVRREYSLE